jgi:hypothetical protein
MIEKNCFPGNLFLINPSKDSGREGDTMTYDDTKENSCV